MTDATTLPRHSARRDDIESYLDDLGVRWTFEPDLRLAKVDQATSLANQARTEPLDPDVVERYAADMACGAQFPPLLVMDPGRDQPMYLLGGNHRFAAHQAVQHTTAPAYVVAAVDELTQVRLRFTDNRLHGLPHTNADRIRTALRLMESGASQAEAAAFVGLPATKLSIAASTVRAGARARDLGVDDRFHQLPEAARYQLSQVKDDDVFRAAGDFAAQAALPVAELRHLVGAVNAVEPLEALRIIGLEAEDASDRTTERSGGVRAPNRTERAQLDSSLATIRGLTPEGVRRSCPNEDVRAVLAQRILDTAGSLRRIHDALTADG